MKKSTIKDLVLYASVLTVLGTGVNVALNKFPKVEAKMPEKQVEELRIKQVIYYNNGEAIYNFYIPDAEDFIETDISSIRCVEKYTVDGEKTVLSPEEYAKTIGLNNQKVLKK